MKSNTNKRNSTPVKHAPKGQRVNSKKNPSNSIKQALRRRSGAAYIDTILSIFLITTIISVFLFIPPAYTHKQNLDYVGTKLVRMVEVTGEINSDIHALADSLSDEMGLALEEYYWEVHTETGRERVNDGGIRRLELRQQFTLVLKSSRTAYYFNVPATMNMSTTLTGVSEVYHKPGS